MMSKDCCHSDGHEGHDHDHGKRDWLIWICTPVILAVYILAAMDADILRSHDAVMVFAHSVFEFVNVTWWGVLLGVFFLALLSHIPREFVMSVLGNEKGAGGIARAMLAGVLLDLCNHGILMIGTKIYQRGASIGQVMAFLIASPWNSLSLTVILIAMIGVKLTLIFIALSCLIAFVSGLIFDALVAHGVLAANPNAFAMPEDFRFFPKAKRQLRETRWGWPLAKDMIVSGLKDSRIVVRWLLVGIVMASILRVFFDPASFEQYFGPSVIGMLATLTLATVLEVCSEGSSPIAADLVTRAGAPGNAFTFLMAGVATDYTEVMVIRDMTKSWKIALFLPLVTMPQVIALGFLLNM